MSDLGVIVTGVAIGSASGIGGALLGACMNGRSQMAGLRLTIQTEDERATRAEKRQAYAACLAAANATLAPLRNFRALQNREEGAGTLREMNDAHLTLINAVAEVELVGAPEVARRANQVVQAAKTYAEQSFAGAAYEVQEILDLDGLVSNLRYTMQANLRADTQGESAVPEVVFRRPDNSQGDPAGPEAAPVQ